MIRVPVFKLELGAVLAAPVRHPGTPDHVLLQAGYALDPDTLKRLRQFNVEHVWIVHPGFDFLDKRLGDRIPETRANLYQSVKKSFTGIAGKTAGSFDLSEYRSVVSDMIMAMIAEKDNAVWAERLMDGDGEVFAHCSNVAYLSLVIGMQVKDYILSQRKHMNYNNGVDLTNLGVGAMLHDLGKLGLEESWHEVHALDERADTDEYRSHVERGYLAVKGRIDATAAHILLHHHQRYDGKHTVGARGDDQTHADPDPRCQPPRHRLHRPPRFSARRASRDDSGRTPDRINPRRGRSFDTTQSRLPHRQRVSASVTARELPGLPGHRLRQSTLIPRVRIAFRHRSMPIKQDRTNSTRSSSH